MNERLTVIQHHPAEAVGELGVWAERRGIAIEIYRADLKELPTRDHGPCVLLGGPYSANAPPVWLVREKAWLRKRAASGVPLLGICLGSQLLAEALGGSVRVLQQPETGWTPVDFTDGSRLDVLQWHEDGFSLPPGAESLASTAACPHQMYASGHRIGIQFHPEWNAQLVAALNAHFGNDSPLPREIDPERHERVSRWFHHRLDAWRASWT
jgi:GMP synthase-like glutamine amidotransferase